MNIDHSITQMRNLSDIASECLKLLLQLRATSNYGNPSELKSRLVEMFDRFENNARRCGFDNEKIHFAKFALVAFLDETIISSDWPEKDEWLSEPLQIKLFDTFNAGEEFFIYLSNLRQRTNVNKDVLEIYYLCLCLGFKGKYQLHSPENLRRIIDDLNLELHQNVSNSIDALSPNGKPTSSMVQSIKTGLPYWIYPVIGFIILILLYVFLSITISNNLEVVINELQRR